MNVLDFQSYKLEKKKISMITCYDYWTARILNQTQIDCILVGDSLSMVVYGFDSTLYATPEMMARHIQAVKKGAPDKFIIGDMPFPSFRKGILEAMNCVDLFMKSGANAIKLEGVFGHEEVIKNIVESGVPVQGHLGLTPQSINLFGGFKVQAKEQDKAQKLIEAAQKLEELGCFSIVLECVPTELAKKVSEKVNIPTIGIGAGPFSDGQVLVLQDMLGMNDEFSPKFLKKYLKGETEIKVAVQKYISEVRDLAFPTIEQSYK